MAPKLLVFAFSGLLGQAAALRVEPSGCPSISDILEGMEQQASEPKAQVTGCHRLAFCVNLTSTGQDEAVALGSLNASIKAMRQFPDDLPVQSACISATSRPLLFNPANARLAGRLGGLNLTLAAYQRWMDVPRMAAHGGDIGAYFAAGCKENLAILGELGGVDLLIQNIRNHFHGKLSDWSYKPVKSSLSGLAAGCWGTAACSVGGVFQLALRLMDEHAGEGELVAEALEVMKTIVFQQSLMRKDFSRAGLMRVLAKVLKANSTQRARLAACEAVSMMTGPVTKHSPHGATAFKYFDGEIQANATSEGVLEQLLAAVTGKGAEEADGVQAECIGALMRMGLKNDANSQAIRLTGLPDRMEAKLTSGTLQALSGKAACDLFSQPGLTPARNTSELCLKLACGPTCAGSSSKTALE